MNSKRYFFGCALLLAASAVESWAGVNLNGYALRGTKGYQERVLEAILRLEPKVDWDDPDTPWPFSAYWLRGTRIGYDRDGASGPSYNTEGEAGIQLFGRSAVAFRYGVTPALSEDVGNYRSRHWAMDVTAGWEGWYPQLAIDRPRWGTGVESRLTMTIGRKTHEERLQVSSRTVRWMELREDVLGAVFSQTYGGATTVHVGGMAHNYDEDIHRLALRGDYLALQNTVTAAPIGLLQGFVKNEWGAGVEQYLGKYVKLSLDWQRASYEAGLIERSDTLRAGVTVFLGLYFAVNGVYETFNPQKQADSSYKGVGLGFRF
ncbi:MAG TPA: hypothetical protein P5079_11340 [Elusimicrobiota bacterium]|nr:hypothetical protein [Elusimicrobiota bacterium]